jgi:hypothetical protein
MTWLSSWLLPDFALLSLPDLPLPLLPDLLSFLAPCSCPSPSLAFATTRNRSRRDAPPACNDDDEDDEDDEDGETFVLLVAMMAAFAASVIK